MSDLTEKNVASVCSSIQSKGYCREFWRRYRPIRCKGLGVGKALDAMAEAGLRNGSRDLTAIVDHDDLRTIQHASTALIGSLSKAYSKAEGNPVAQEYILAFAEDVTGPFERALATALQTAKIQQDRDQGHADQERLDRNDLSIYTKFIGRCKDQLKTCEQTKQDTNNAIEAMNSFMGQWLKMVNTKVADLDWRQDQMRIARDAMQEWDKGADVYKSAYSEVEQRQKECVEAYKGLPRPETKRMKQEMAVCKQLFDALEAAGTIVQERLRIYFKGYHLHTKTLDKMEAAIKNMPSSSAEGI